MKKTLLFAVALLVAGALNVAANATVLDTAKVDGIWYIFDKDALTATVTYGPASGESGMWGGIGKDTYGGKLIIPEKVNYFDGSNYYDCNVTAVGDNAFAWCTNLSQITIPASVKRLGVNLLQRSEGVTTLVFADGNEPIVFGRKEFETGVAISFEDIAYMCKTLYLGRKIVVEDTEASDVMIFHTWSEVEDVTFGEAFTEIPVAFCPYARKLNRIQINSSVVLNPGVRMFAFLEEDTPKPDAKAITLYVPEGMAKTYAGIEGWSRFTIQEMDVEQRYHIKYVSDIFDFFINGLYYKRTSSGVSVVIPQVWYLNPDGSYVNIWSSEFPYKQTAITIPDSITVYLDGYTDYSLTPKAGYEKATFAVAEIGDYCFRGANNLERLIIPSTVKTVGIEAFEYTMKLKSLDIPESIIHTGWLAFARAGFEEIVIPASCSVWEYGEGTAVFQECENLRKATFAPGTTRIPDRIFFGCTALRSIIMPDEVKEIGAGAFAGCYALADLHLPASLEAIHARMFQSCPLRELEIPAAVKEVGEAALLATLLTKLTVNSANKKFDSRDNCNAIIRTADNTLVAATDGTFIPETVDSIAEMAFVELDGIHSVTLPKGLKSIAPYAFHNLNNLTIITSYITNPAGVLKENGFSSDWETVTPQNTATLYVPAGTLAAYKADAEWGKFKHIVEMTDASKPAEVEDLKPLAEDGGADLTKITSETDITNTVVDNLYLTCDTANGDHYDATEKALVFKTVVDEYMLSNILAAPGNMDIIRNNFSGIIIEIPAGKGTITITFKTTSGRELAVTIGKEVAQRYAQAVKGAIDINFDVEQNTYVYIYPVEKDEILAAAPSKVHARKAVAEEKDDSVNIYGAQWQIKNTISGIEETAAADNAVDLKVQKIFRNRQLYILRDGRMYTATGAEVK